MSNKRMDEQASYHDRCRFKADKPWLDRQYHDNRSIKKPNELETTMQDPPQGEVDNDVLDRIQGSMVGMALGDALGAFVEFRPHQFLVDNPVKDMHGGGTWGLQKGQFTDDTSMALCLANSLIARRDFVPYDQLVRYKWWFRDGYMSSTGKCFDIGAATKDSLTEFEHRQEGFAKRNGIHLKEMDFLSDPGLIKEFNVSCSREGVAGNGALMRLAPVPLFFHEHPLNAVAFSGFSGVISHGDRIAFDACRYYGALIVAAVHGLPKEELLDKNFYQNYARLFDNIPVHPDIIKIAEGSYQKGGYDKGIRGKGYIVSALEAALWAFWSERSFEAGALAAVNLGDDTDTTAAIYGQLAGAYYGYKDLPKQWLQHLYASKFMQCLSKWIVYEGTRWQPGGPCTVHIPPITSQPESNAANAPSVKRQEQLTGQPTYIQRSNSQSKAQRFRDTWCSVNPKHKSNHNVPYSNQKSTSESAPPNNNDAASPQLHNSSANQNSSNQHSLRHSLSMYSSIPIYFCDNLQSCEDVARWLHGFGEDYSVYASAFYADFVDGFWLLNYINDQNLLKKYRVENSNHRQAILNEIQKLKGISATKL